MSYYKPDDTHQQGEGHLQDDHGDVTQKPHDEGIQKLPAEKAVEHLMDVAQVVDGVVDVVDVKEGVAEFLRLAHEMLLAEHDVDGDDEPHNNVFKDHHSAPGAAGQAGNHVVDVGHGLV